jgi:hypothetical protein
VREKLLPYLNLEIPVPADEVEKKEV